MRNSKSKVTVQEAVFGNAKIYNGFGGELEIHCQTREILTLQFFHTICVQLEKGPPGSEFLDLQRFALKLRQVRNLLPGCEFLGCNDSYKNCGKLENGQPGT